MNLYGQNSGLSQLDPSFAQALQESQTEYETLRSFQSTLSQIDKYVAASAELLEDVSKTFHLYTNTAQQLGTLQQSQQAGALESQALCSTQAQLHLNAQMLRQFSISFVLHDNEISLLQHGMPTYSPTPLNLLHVRGVAPTSPPLTSPPHASSSALSSPSRYIDSTLSSPYSSPQPSYASLSVHSPASTTTTPPATHIAPSHTHPPPASFSAILAVLQHWYVNTHHITSSAQTRTSAPLPSSSSSSSLSLTSSPDTSSSTLPSLPPPQTHSHSPPHTHTHIHAHAHSHSHSYTSPYTLLSSLGVSVPTPELVYLLTFARACKVMRALAHALVTVHMRNTEQYQQQQQQQSVYESYLLSIYNVVQHAHRSISSWVVAALEYTDASTLPSATSTISINSATKMTNSNSNSPSSSDNVNTPHTPASPQSPDTLSSRTLHPQLSLALRVATLIDIAAATDHTSVERVGLSDSQTNETTTHTTGPAGAALTATPTTLAGATTVMAPFSAPTQAPPPLSSTLSHAAAACQWTLKQTLLSLLSTDSKSGFSPGSGNSEMNSGSSTSHASEKIKDILRNASLIQETCGAAHRVLMESIYEMKYWFLHPLDPLSEKILASIFPEGGDPELLKHTSGISFLASIFPDAKIPNMLFPILSPGTPSSILLQWSYHSFIFELLSPILKYIIPKLDNYLHILLHYCQLSPDPSSTSSSFLNYSSSLFASTTANDTGTSIGMGAGTSAVDSSLSFEQLERAHAVLATALEAITDIHVCFAQLVQMCIGGVPGVSATHALVLTPTTITTKSSGSTGGSGVDGTTQHGTSPDVASTSTSSTTNTGTALPPSSAAASTLPAPTASSLITAPALTSLADALRLWRRNLWTHVREYLHAYAQYARQLLLKPLATLRGRKGERGESGAAERDKEREVETGMVYVIPNTLSLSSILTPLFNKQDVAIQRLHTGPTLPSENVKFLENAFPGAFVDAKQDISTLIRFTLEQVLSLTTTIVDTGVILTPQLDITTPTAGQKAVIMVNMYNLCVMFLKNMVNVAESTFITANTSINTSALQKNLHLCVNAQCTTILANFGLLPIIKQVTAWERELQQYKTSLKLYISQSATATTAAASTSDTATTPVLIDAIASSSTSPLSTSSSPSSTSTSTSTASISATLPKPPVPLSSLPHTDLSSLKHALSTFTAALYGHHHHASASAQSAHTHGIAAGGRSGAHSASLALTLLEKIENSAIRGKCVTAVFRTLLSQYSLVLQAIHKPEAGFPDHVYTNTHNTISPSTDTATATAVTGTHGTGEASAGAGTCVGCVFMPLAEMARLMGLEGA